jgi:hypothetical protein
MNFYVPFCPHNKIYKAKRHAEKQYDFTDNHRTSGCILIQGVHQPVRSISPLKYGIT